MTTDTVADTGRAVEPGGLDASVAFDGGEVKALGGGKVAGYLVRFGTPETADVYGEFFDAGTSFGRARELDILYDHGMPMRRGGYWPVFRNRPLGAGEVKARPDGLWFEGELDLSIPHVPALYADVEAGRMGWSSGSTERLVIREPVKSRLGRLVNYLKRWPLNEATLSPKPVDPNNKAYAIKALIEADHPGLITTSDRITTDHHMGGGATPGPSLSDDLCRLAADAERFLGLATKAFEQRLADGRTLSRAKLDAIKAVGEAYLDLHRRCEQGPVAAPATTPPAPVRIPDDDLDLDLGLLSMFEAARRR